MKLQELFTVMKDDQQIMLTIKPPEIIYKGTVKDVFNDENVNLAFQDSECKITGDVALIKPASNNLVNTSLNIYLCSKWIDEEYMTQ